MAASPRGTPIQPPLEALHTIEALRTSPHSAHSQVLSIAERIKEAGVYHRFATQTVPETLAAQVKSDLPLLRSQVLKNGILRSERKQQNKKFKHLVSANHSL
jgi:hypothetical protein